MRTLSFVVVAMTLVLGPFLAPVIGAEDHVMVTPNDLKWPSSRNHRIFYG
jgi:hypothetical protein